MDPLNPRGAALFTEALAADLRIPFIAIKRRLHNLTDLMHKRTRALSKYSEPNVGLRHKPRAGPLFRGGGTD